MAFIHKVKGLGSTSPFFNYFTTTDFSLATCNCKKVCVFKPLRMKLNIKLTVNLGKLEKMKRVNKFRCIY
jgi:hypothetical protein